MRQRCGRWERREQLNRKYRNRRSPAKSWEYFHHPGDGFFRYATEPGPKNRSGFGSSRLGDGSQFDPWFAGISDQNLLATVRQVSERREFLRSLTLSHGFHDGYD